MVRNAASTVVVGIVLAVIVLHSAPAEAQRVWVGDGGVSVRAPFVRVDVGPAGGVSVRAPFTALDVPPRGYFEYYEPGYYDDGYLPPRVVERRFEPRFPTPEDFAAMSDERLSRAIVSIDDALHQQLSRFNTADTWHHYFRFDPEMADFLLPPEERLAELATLLEKFQRIEADPQYSMISGLSAFQAMKAAVNEAVARTGNDGASDDNGADEDLPIPPQEQLPPPERPTARSTSETRIIDGSRRDEPFLRPRPRQ